MHPLCDSTAVAHERSRKGQWQIEQENKASREHRAGSKVVLCSATGVGKEKGKMRKTVNLEPDDCASIYIFNIDQPSSSVNQPILDDCSGSQHVLKKDLPTDQFLSVPSHFTWNKPKPGHTPIFRTSSLPPLDWPLPSRYEQCELKIEVQPKTHHRAHYETEGSRGAVKASTGGHPVVKLLGYNEKQVNLQMFIGTADDRYLRPHAFYQVHRITGKTVATASQEIIIASTKVLEIPLLPENKMSASIDCAGILKLRNSDIELRKGETDIGRKNTRVRLVFRVHIPQTGGKVLSLQTASIPVECSQRSAQELPQIEKYSINSCSVNGGQEMVVTGSNFLPESKIIFFEKGQDGRPQWEVEGKIIREKCQGTNIVLEVPPYHNKAITAAVQVQFYLCNGKRKKSQSQRFNYTPVVMKQEHRDEMDLSAVPSLTLPHTGSVQGLHSIRTQLPSSDPGHPHDSLLSTSPRSLVCPVQQPYTSMVTSAVPHLSHIQDAAAINIKPEPEDRELNFQTIGLQDITLDDVNEIIGRDMSQISVTHGATVASQSPHVCPGSLETEILDEVQ
ncbi:nuclear factor of activated T-cells, cytoplasmic 3 isoform B [Alligator mississippiensis]|uniref:Nuclear factor of activated T-cells, cytoplasmic 3 isoform B n=2 Tax=Alligator mississippiensis TaxID=8496 RepID=A0A151MS93_ALLMI|nr:nuclear factor of activated T-cells, cytoplasmic 3 isoform B [Alligator mississippiensis]